MTYPQVVQQPVRPSDVRPRRSWYWIAVAIVVATLAAGPGLYFLGGYDSLGPKIVAEFDTGSPATVRLTADKQWGIYVDNPSPDPAENKIPTDCTIRGLDGGEVTLNSVGYSFFFEKDGRRWDLLGQVDVTKDGQYQFDCKPLFEGESYHYGVSDLAGFSGAAGSALGSVGLLAGLPCLGIVIALIIVIVTLVRRSGNQKKLQRQAAYPPPGFPPPPGYPPGYSPQGYPPSGYR